MGRLMQGRNADRTHSRVTRSDNRRWQDALAEGLLYAAAGIISLTGVNTVVVRLEEALARLVPVFEPTVTMATSITACVTVLVCASIILKKSAIRQRVMPRNVKRPIVLRRTSLMLVILIAIAGCLIAATWRISGGPESLEPPAGMNVSTDRLVDAYTTDKAAATRAYNTRWLSLAAEVENVEPRVAAQHSLRLKTTRENAPAVHARFASDQDDVFGDVEAGAFVSMTCRGAVFHTDIQLQGCALRSFSNHK